MKQTKFEKVVEGDKDELRDAWMFGTISLLFPIAMLIDNNVDGISFLDVVIGSFLNGIVFVIFVISALEYVRSRKVYWRKIK